MLFRPIMTYVREHSIIPLMDTAIDLYLLIVWIYFAFNMYYSFFHNKSMDNKETE